MLDILPQKRCTGCKEWKAPSEFGKYARGKGGLNPRCRACEYDRRLQYRQDNKNSIKEYLYKWVRDNREKKREYSRTWAANNPEKRKASFKKFSEANKGKIAAWAAKWHLSNIERHKEMLKSWRSENREKYLAQKRNRRALKKGALGDISAQEWESLKKFYNYTCLRCKRQEPEIKLTHDHVKPLIMGGENTIRNSQPLCRSCNSKKGTKWIDYR